MSFNSFLALSLFNGQASEASEAAVFRRFAGLKGSGIIAEGTSFSSSEIDSRHPAIGPPGAFNFSKNVDASAS